MEQGSESGGLAKSLTQPLRGLAGVSHCEPLKATLKKQFCSCRELEKG